MMILRYVGRLNPPGRWPFGYPWAEAMMAGVGAVLGPADVVRLPATAPLHSWVTGDTSITVRLRPGASSDHHGNVCALFCPRAHLSRQAVTVGGGDVEAILAAAAAAVRTVRAGDGTHLLWIPPGGHIAGHDPITVLATRMYAAGQLDDNAFLAVDADARRLAGSLTRAGGEPRRAAMTLVTQAEVRLAPVVTTGCSPTLL